MQCYEEAMCTYMQDAAAKWLVRVPGWLDAISTLIVLGNDAMLPDMLLPYNTMYDKRGLSMTI